MDPATNGDNFAPCHAWQSIQDTQGLLHAIVQSSKKISIYCLDRAYRLIFFNSVHKHIIKKNWGVDVELGMCLPDVFDAKNRAKSIGLFDRALAGEHVNTIVEWKNPIPHKASRYRDVTYSPIVSNHGDIIALSAIAIDVSAQKIAEKELRNYQRRLEAQVEIRTRELTQKEEQLRGQKQNLEEANVALRVLLEQRERDKKDLEENIHQNTKQLITPYLHRLKQGQLTAKQATLMDMLETNLMNMISPYIKNLSRVCERLSPMETQVADLVRGGRTNDEIAQLLSVAPPTVAAHRQHIRAKLGLKNKKINLRTYLQSLSSNPVMTNDSP